MKKGFKGGNLIKCTGEEAISDSLVLIEDSKLVYAGKNDGRDTSLFEMSDISGMTIMPGLVNGHIHFSGTTTASPRDWMAEDNLYEALVASSQAKTILDYGFTSARDFSRCGVHLRKAINEGIIEGPRIFTHGRGMCRTGGHGDWPEYPPELVEAQHPWGTVVDTEDDLRKATRRLLRQNVDGIKIFATGGGFFATDRDLDAHYTKKEIMAVVEEASYFGLSVSAHAENRESIALCVEAGVRCIEHGDDIDDRTIALMAEKRVFLVPTLVMFVEWYGHAQAIPPYRPILDEMPGDTLGEKEINRIYNNFRKCKEAGVPLAVGADSYTNDITPYGVTDLKEVHMFVTGGCTEMEALIYATRYGAELLGFSDKVGTLEEGKEADLIILSKNPLEDIKNLSYENIRTVLKGGKKVNRPSV